MVEKCEAEEEGAEEVKPGEPTRFVCGECQIAFDLTVAPFDQWREQFEPGTEPDGELAVMPDAECPFCGKRELRAHADPAVIATRPSAP
ncbi:MAG TPA: hypothetical protein VFE62_03560 [Gemmataceae bacterium]|nr:hypothetical protein [Gemmataceae bacterium]